MLNKEKDTIYSTYHSFRDDQERYHFTVEWWDENFYTGPTWRVQGYFTSPLAKIETYKDLGFNIVEIGKRRV